VECLNFVLSLLNSIVLCMSYMCWFDQRLHRIWTHIPFSLFFFRKVTFLGSPCRARLLFFFSFLRPVNHTFLFPVFFLLSTPASFCPFSFLFFYSCFSFCTTLFLYIPVSNLHRNWSSTCGMILLYLYHDFVYARVM
jgi:hypothetical protein